VANEHWLLLGVLLLVLALRVAVKKFHLLDARPDRKITYKAVGANALTLHVFRARNAGTGAASPAVLFFHGGGWLYGGPEQFYPQCQYLCERGFTCFSTQYRLGDDSQPDLRGAVEDARAAFTYLADHAGELNIDPRHIVAGGGSSGGHLAAALGTALAPAPTGTSSGDIRRPAALVLYNPILDLSPGTPNHSLVKENWEEVSPIHHVDDAVPASLVLLGSQDAEAPVATVEAFRKAVRDAGGRCEVALYEGQGHGFFNQPDYLEKTNLRVLQFLSAL